MRNVIIVEGGLVQPVGLRDVPKELQKPICLAGLLAEIRDCNTEGLQPDELATDTAGEQYRCDFRVIELQGGTP